MYNPSTYPTDYEDDERATDEWQRREDALERAEHLADLKQSREDRDL